MTCPAAPELLRIRGLRKSYAAPVLCDVDFAVAAGEVHALIGANGAGKTTLSKIIGGLVRPDAGQMQFAGASYAPRQKAEAEARGVHIIQQELNLIGTLSVAENLFLNRLPHRFGVVSRRTMHDMARQALRLVSLEEVDPDTPLARLGVSHQQLVEIAAALSRDCRLLILDEPTAALTDPQIDMLFAHLERLRQVGVAMVYISHRMDELRRIADRATILRDGRVVCTAPLVRLTSDEIVQLLTGKEVQQESRHRVRQFGPAALRVRDLTRHGVLRGVSLDVWAGEIFGVAGLVGSGRTELVRAIFGADRADAGSVQTGRGGVPRRFRSPREAIAAGLAMVPEDRRQHGLLLPQTIRTNVTLSNLAAFANRCGCIGSSAERAAAERSCGTLQIHCRGLEQRVEELSGGNQQKVVIARWLMREADVYLFDEPTRGIDVAAKAVVYHLLNELADRGKAVVFVSSELRELLAICDRIGVMSAGRLAAIFARDAWSQEQILHAALSGYQR